MREIKYRYIVTEPAKNITHRLYHTLEGIERLDPNHPIFKPSYKIAARNLYTGMKDRNGVEIYEGDIFRGKELSPFKVPEQISIVSFHPFYGYSWGYWNLNSIVVIGNVYENPELLEVSE